MPVVRFMSFPLIKTGKWAFPASEKDKIIDHGGFPEFKQAHTWFEQREGETTTPERKGAYKLPHHVLRGDSLKTHRQGMIAAMAALNGARGGVNVPSGDRQGIWNHLSRHYAEFDLEPPELKPLSLEAFNQHHLSQGVSESDMEEALELAGEMVQTWDSNEGVSLSQHSVSRRKTMLRGRRE